MIIYICITRGSPLHDHLDQPAHVYPGNWAWAKNDYNFIRAHDGRVIGGGWSVVGGRWSVWWSRSIRGAWVALGIYLNYIIVNYYLHYTKHLLEDTEIEYIIVHEMVHLLERHHNDRFTAYMNQFMPQWPFFRDELNKAPLGHAEWDY